MQAKQALADIQPPENLDTSAVAELGGKIDHMIRMLDDQMLLHRIALLEPGNVLRFPYGGNHEIAVSLPYAQDDFVQRWMVRNRGFYEARHLATVHGMKLVTPATTVCDIGAGFGNSAIFFGKVMGAKRILAFEPQVNVYNTLCKNLELNGLSDALAYNCLVGAKSGRGDVTEFHPQNMGRTSFAAAKEGNFPMVALDDLSDADEMKGLGFIKIDVEGMQLDILQGAKKLLKANKPAIWQRMSTRDGSFAEVGKMLSSLGYSAVQIGQNDHIFTAG